MGIEGFWQFYHTSFYSQRLLILKLVLCFKSGIYWLTVRPSAAHQGLRWGIHYEIRTVKHWNRSCLSPAAVAVASSFSKLLILLLAHLEALLPSGKSNSTVCATRLTADDQWHSWDGTGSCVLSHLCEMWGWSFSQCMGHRIRCCFRSPSLHSFSKLWLPKICFLFVKKKIWKEKSSKFQSWPFHFTLWLPASHFCLCQTEKGGVTPRSGTVNWQHPGLTLFFSTFLLVSATLVPQEA